MGYDKRENAKPYEPTEGDTLKDIARRETEAGNPISWQEIARFNWGTDDPDTIDELLRDELGCYKRATDKRFMFTSDVQVRTPLLIPQPFTKAGLSTQQTHTIKVKKQQKPPKQFEGCVRVEGVTFEYNSDKIRASEEPDVAKIAQRINDNPSTKAMIFGHTDKVGSDTFNKDLSERRAKSLFKHLTTKLGVDPGRFMDPKHMGCGEFNPEKDVETAHEPNRRVTVFLFNPDRLPNLPCVNGSIAPCKKQIAAPLPRHKDSFRCSFYDSIAKNCPDESGVKPVPPVEPRCVSTKWIDTEAFCGDEARLESEISENPPDGPATVEILHPSTGAAAETINANLTGGKVQAKWVAKAMTADWRTDKIKFRVKAAGITCESSNEFSFKQRPTTGWILIDKGHASGNGFADVAEHHDARLEADRVHYSLKLRLIGDPFSDAKRQAAKTLIQNVWNNGFSNKRFHRTKCKRGDACNCTFDCCKAGFRLDVNFVDSGEHVLVTVHATAPGQPTFRSSMGRNTGDWGDPAKSPTTTYPHETGHVLGQYDEYPNGAIDPNFSAANPDTQPPDAVAAGSPNLMSTPGNQTLLNRHYRYVKKFLNDKAGGDPYKIIPP